jgi:glycosyltransferase involved in cell wall biosynthesis
MRQSVQSQNPYIEGSRSISVCMATYNGEKFLAEQLDSILAQMNDGDELIVSDDSSSDRTAAILREYRGRIEIVGKGRAGGVVRNFCRALDHARCEYILLADQDDVWYPGRLDFYRSHLPNYSLIMTDAVLVDADLQPTGATLFQTLRPKAGFLRNFYRNSFVGCCIGFHRSVLDLVLPIPRWAPWHDWIIGLTAGAIGKVAFMDVPTMFYRRHGNNASPTGEGSKNNLRKKLLTRIGLFLSLGVVLMRYLCRRTNYNS